MKSEKKEIIDDINTVIEILNERSIEDVLC
ncbi:hypothetical protein LCGC14_0606790 [marine sediment metagenome]|uniref:Uncharacterized protein n=1 Tax=marine sediment metagenome TaxID=412755 RepID=A0A0F9R8Y4_9ZZZZ